MDSVARRHRGYPRRSRWPVRTTSPVLDAGAIAISSEAKKGLLRTKKVLKIERRAAAELEPAFGAFKAAWDHFAATEPELSADLSAQCRSALGSIASTD